MLFSFVCSQSVTTKECLIEKKLYHRETNTCLTPLLQGPCLDGEWVVLDGVSGEGVCQPKKECTPGRRALLSETGGVVCGCPDGWEEVEGSCEKLFEQSFCKKGNVFMPEHFSTESKICSAGFSCTKASSCMAYTVTKLSRMGTSRRKQEIKFLKEMVCSRASRSICCPNMNDNSLFTSSNILQSMIPVKAKCVKNPCGPGLWPWVGSSGVLQCLKKEKSVEGCPFQLIEEDGMLVCPWFSEEFILNTVAPKSGRNCGRRRRWIYGRCRMIFG